MIFLGVELVWHFLFCFISGSGGLWPVSDSLFSFCQQEASCNSFIVVVVFPNRSVLFSLTIMMHWYLASQNRVICVISILPVRHLDTMFEWLAFPWEREKRNISNKEHLAREEVYLLSSLAFHFSPKWIILIGSFDYKCNSCSFKKQPQTVTDI